MKRLVPLLFLFTAPAYADLSHSITTSTQLTVNGAYTDASRIGSTYAVSGSNIKVASSDDHFGKLVAPSGNTAATLDPGTYDINTVGSAFSFSESFSAGDNVNPIGTGVDVTSGVVADMPAYGEVLTMSGGVAGTLAGTVTSAGVVTVTAGGANTSAIGSVVTNLTIK